MHIRLVLFAVLLVLGGCAGVQEIITGSEMVSIQPLAEAPQKPSRPLVGYLSKPDGVGPFPAVVLMHGCGGLDQHAQNYMKDFASEYRRMGFVALILDSYSPRGLGNICTGTGSGGPNGVLNQDDRAWDVYAAIRFFEGLGYVDTSRVVAHGFSHGAMTALSAIDHSYPVKEKVAAAIAYYPWCRQGGSHTAPSLVLIGGSDGWTPASACQFMAQFESKTTVKVYPGVYHSFVIPLPMRTVNGYTLAYNAAAVADSWKEIRSFLKNNALIRPPQ